VGRKAKNRRQSHGSAWHWKQTDCWYCTHPGTRKRLPLLDEHGQRIRGKDRREAADIALARAKLSWEADSAGPSDGGQWLVARICSEYLQHCERGAANGSISPGHRTNATAWLNDLCAYCGALPVAQLTQEQVQTWIAEHESWRSPATIRSVIAIVLAAFNRGEKMRGIANPLKGLKKPASKPRLASFSPEEEQLIYGATEPRFGDFLFAAIHTGLRPFCELARLTADNVEESDRGMMWRVWSSKTKKTRKIPVRPEVAERVHALLATAPKGSGKPIFRNTQGKPWKPTAGVVRFLTLKAKLGWDQDPVRRRYSCYTSRHTFAHRMLSGYWTGGAGCSIETLAELIGDTPKVAFDHYGREWGQHYQDPLWSAIGEGNKAGSSSTRAGSQKKRSSARRPKAGKKHGTTAASAKRRATPTRRETSACSRAPRGKRPI